MNIFLISNLYPSKKYPHFGTFVKGFEDSICEQGANVTHKVVIDKKYNSKLQLLLVYLWFYLKVIFIGLKGNYDLIYVHYIAHTSLPVLFLSFIRSSKIILNVHGDDILPRTRLVAFFQRFICRLLKKTALVVVPSDYFKKVFLERFEYNESQVFIYPSGGVNRDIFRPQSVEKVNFGFLENDFVLGFISRISEGKGWDIFVQAVKEMNSKRPFIKGVIVGDGEQVDSLKKMLNDEGLLDVINFIGRVSHDDLPPYYSVMDLFIFPSTLHESLGLVGLEAMACGVPVIGSDMAGIKTYVTEGYNGSLFSVNDKADLVDKILLYSNLSADSRLMMRKNCLNTALEYDSVENSKKLYAKLLELAVQPSCL